MKSRSIRRRFKRSLNSDGELIDLKYVLFVNNVEPSYFSSREDLDSYLRSFRKENDIFKLQIFRIETYSL